MVDVLQVYATKAIPDAKLSIKKYLDTKFEYLSFCLKIKEMEDEEVNMAGSGAYYLPRMEEGNYDYRCECDAPRFDLILLLGSCFGAATKAARSSRSCVST